MSFRSIILTTFSSSMVIPLSSLKIVNRFSGKIHSFEFSSNLIRLSTTETLPFNMRSTSLSSAEIFRFFVEDSVVSHSSAESVAERPVWSIAKISLGSSSSYIPEELFGLITSLRLDTDESYPANVSYARDESLSTECSSLLSLNGIKAASAISAGWSRHSCRICQMYCKSHEFDICYFIKQHLPAYNPPPRKNRFSTSNAERRTIKPAQ